MTEFLFFPFSMQDDMTGAFMLVPLHLTEKQCQVVGTNLRQGRSDWLFYEMSDSFTWLCLFRYCGINYDILRTEQK